MGFKILQHNLSTRNIHIFSIACYHRYTIYGTKSLFGIFLILVHCVTEFKMVETSGCFVWCPSIAIRGRAGQRGREKGADCDVTEAKEDRKTRKEEAELKALEKM